MKVKAMSYGGYRITRSHLDRVNLETAQDIIDAIHELGGRINALDGQLFVGPRPVAERHAIGIREYKPELLRLLERHDAGRNQLTPANPAMDAATAGNGDECRKLSSDVAIPTAAPANPAMLTAGASSEPTIEKPSTLRTNHFRESALGWYLTEFGWTQVDRPGRYPLWKRGEYGKEMEASAAWEITLEEMNDPPAQPRSQRDLGLSR